MKKETVKIKTLTDNNRMSTQELLQLISSKIAEGYTDFDIEACGQHNIGGSSWALNREEKLNFKITNPGQRAGAMALSGTRITIEGSAPADVGWLNSGAKIIVNGDCGDTAAHCAAGGKIFVSGRVGTRSGALMKHDPKYNPPEFWVLKNTGSFSFEFMGGGIAVVCGYDCEGLSSVLGNRSCVGMVGGCIYVRGPIANIADCVEIKELEENDIEFLKTGLKDFLQNIDKSYLYDELTLWNEWKKIAAEDSSHKTNKMSVAEFRQKTWIKDGIFSDFINDDYVVYKIPAVNEGRVHIPHWTKTDCIKCNICVKNCPRKAIEVKDNSYNSINEKCIGCGICAAVCPKKCWTMSDNRKEIL